MAENNTMTPAEELMPAAYPYLFPPYTHTVVGSYLMVIGVLGTLGNGIILAMFLRFRSLVSPTTLLLVNLAVSDLGLILFGFPFSAPSSFSGRWIFGEGGCQWYAFTGFLFGSAHIGTLSLLAIDRYLITCKVNIRLRMISQLRMYRLVRMLRRRVDVENFDRNSYHIASNISIIRDGGKLTYRRYCHMLSAVWAYAFFWAAMPLLGWGRYGLEPSITTCTIDWQHSDASYKSFILVYTVLGFFVPLIIIIICYSAVSRHMRRKAGNGGGSAKLRRPVYDQWADERFITYMSIILVIAFVVAWSPYAVLCLWPLFDDPITVPPVLTLLPPLFAKASTVFNPIIYYMTNPKLRKGMMAIVACGCQPPPPEIIEIPDSPERMPATGDTMG